MRNESLVTLNSQVSEANAIDLICDAFENAWSEGECPSISDYVATCDPPLRNRLFDELVRVDCELRQKLNEDIGQNYYEDRFPEFADRIACLSLDTNTLLNGEPERRGPAVSFVAGLGVGHFRLLEEVGWGAFGTVWRAQDNRLGRIVAVKFPRQERLTETESQRFLREGRAAAKLRHPNIVTLFDVGEENGRTYIVSEFVEGVNLREWLDQSHRGHHEIADLVAQLAEALHHAHEQGVIHRDLKPANVLVDRDSRPHITDFGLAKMSSDSTMTLEGNILGTPAYMSPEQASGDVIRIDRRTDVYALGAVLYELLTGSPPFAGDAAPIIHQVIHVEPRSPRKVVASIPSELETICLKALDKDPARRYPSAQEMAVDLRRYLRGDPIFARRANVLQKGWRWIRQRPTLAAAIILPAIVVTSAGIVIKHINDESYRKQGYQDVRVTTNPPGARIAIVPIDKRTGEPNVAPDAVVRLVGKTPLVTKLKPGDYLVEGVLYSAGGDPAGIAEVYRTVLPPEELRRSDVRRDERDGQERRVRNTTFQFDIRPNSEVIADMVAVPIGPAMREKNPLLPKVLYVDRNETNPDDTSVAGTTQNGEPYITFEMAKRIAQTRHKRLPSAAEYEAINDAALDGAIRTNGSKLEDVFSGAPEWTTTKYDFPGAADTRENVRKLNNMQVLKGYGDPGDALGLLHFIGNVLLAPVDAETPGIGFRGVRSAVPRFVEAR